MLPVDMAPSTAAWTASQSQNAGTLRDVSQRFDALQRTSRDEAGDSEVRAKFDEFVGGVFFGEMLKAMRKTVDKPAYFHGGRAEEIFTAQYDQMLTEHLTEASASQFTEPMYDLFTLTRQ